MSSVLAVGFSNSSIEKILECFVSEGLDVVTSKGNAQDVDYILYSTLKEQQGNFAKDVYSLRELASQNKSRLVLLLHDSKKDREELKRSAQIDERHVFVSSTNPLFTKELWEELKKTIFSPSYKNAGVHIRTQEEKVLESIQPAGIKPVIHKEKETELRVIEGSTQEPLVTEKKLHSRKNKSNVVSFISILIAGIVFLVLPFIELKSGELLIKHSQSSRGIAIAKNLLGGAERGFLVYKQTPLVGKFFNSREKKARQLADFAGILEEYKKISKTGKDLVSQMFDDSQILEDRLISTRNDLEQTARDLDFLIAEKEPGSLDVNIEEVRRKVKGLQGTLAYLQQLVLNKQELDLLILFNDSSQLKGSGGAIVGYGVLTIREGKVQKFLTYSPEEIDKAIKGEVAPPDLLKEQLKQNTWYFKDSTWSPDFSAAGERAMWFYKKATGKDTQGVIAIDTELIKNLLKAQGQIPGDFYNSIQKAGSGYVLDKANEVYEQLTLNTLETLDLFSEPLFRGLEEKHLVVKVKDKPLADVLNELSWDGGVEGDSCLNGEVCFDDYLQIVSTNLNGNRQAIQLENDYKLEVILAGGEAQHKLTIRRDSAKGELREYLRIYTPKGTEMAEPVILGVTQEKLKLDKATEAGKSLHGFVLETPKRVEREVVVTWTTKVPSSVSTKQYNLIWQKQSGALGAKALIDIKYPDKETPQYFLSPDARALTLAGGFLYNTVLSQDLNLRLLWK